MAGMIYVVGIGPGSEDYLTPRARKAIINSDVIVGYKVYIELIQNLIQTQEVISNGMKQEIDRVKKVIELAKEGKTVSLVSSGDAGVYGMAGPVYQLAEEMGVDAEIEVVPGVTAVLAAASRLGAPLMHDFVVISLSDLLTPWEKIVKRLHAAGEGDFVVSLYNPRSKKRRSHLIEAQEILLKYRKPETPVGIVWNGTREKEEMLVTTLAQIPHEEVNMFATLIIGNSETYISKGRIITPRGY
ncbi:MAG: precorrin-3B C(17)-methyltransferase [Halanaerobiales bacterium]|nr:precorrin-3B C(17)-methyltransferase [Halanaerobiales bacterium]